VSGSNRVPIVRALAPLGLLLIGCWAVIAFSSKNVGRFVLDQAWCRPSLSHILGCADGGVDVAKFVAFAIGYVLMLALGVAVVGAILGTALGATAAFVGGAIEQLLLKTCDLVQAFPNFLLALAVLAAVEQPRRWHIGAVFVLTAWAGFARLAAVQSRKLVVAEFVIAARAFGASRGSILRNHIVPHVLGPVAIQVGTVAAGVVIGESALAFVGLGPADGISLGVLIEQGAVGMLRAPHVLIFSACAVALASGACQLAAEGLRLWVRRS
jgi:ABC-type dipeptide/oligopeptide/nickel transport system permease subunit